MEKEGAILVMNWLLRAAGLPSVPTCTANTTLTKTIVQKIYQN